MTERQSTGSLSAPQITQSQCPKCQGVATGVSQRYYCERCHCIWTENADDGNVPPVKP